MSIYQRVLQSLRAFRIQQLLVVGFTLLIFWHGFWAGAPRSDQIHYLHQVSQYTTVHDILQYAPDWNRAKSPGDAVLYRPVLYVLLGMEYAFFGLHFFLWQTLALSLHMLAALLLLSLFWKTTLRTTIWPVAITCSFATVFISADLVIWNHLTGYVLFDCLMLVSVNAVISFIQTPTTNKAFVGIFSAAAAMFTYELGLVYVVLAGAATCWTAATADRAGRSGRRTGLYVLGTALMLLPLAYVWASAANFRSTAAVRGTSSMPPPITVPRLEAGLRDTALQLVYWVKGAVLPTTLQIAPYSRASLVGITYRTSFVYLLNYAAVLLLFAGAVPVIWWRLRRGFAGVAATVLLGGLLCCYSAIIAFGRSLDRGLDYTERINLYYAYFPVLAVSMAPALLAVDIRKPLCDRSVMAGRMVKLGSAALGTGLVIVTALNGWSTYHFCRTYRYEYSSLRLALIDRIAQWRAHAGSAENAFFRVGPGCDAVDEPLADFGPHVRRGAHWRGPFRLADALFPEKSFVLNESWLKDAAISVTEIPCPVQEVWNPKSVVGNWTIDSLHAACRIQQSGAQLVFQNDRGATAHGSINDGVIRVLPPWNIEGRLGSDGQAILWSNGTAWYRWEPVSFAKETDPTLGAPDVPIPLVSSFQPGYPATNLNDGTERAWGSEGGDRDTYAVLFWRRPRRIHQIRVEVFSPQGRAHLRDIRVIQADEIASGKPEWHIVRARLVKRAPYAEKLTVPPLKDGQWITIDLDAADPNWGSHRYWGLGCFTGSRGDERNYLAADGDGVYIRELAVN